MYKQSCFFTSTNSIISIIIVIYVLTTCNPTQTKAEESLDVYIPSKYKLLFNEYNAVVFGEALLAKAAIRGSLAIQGRGNLLDFDIGNDNVCDGDKRSLIVGDKLKARSGKIHNGYTVVGRGSKIHHSVEMTCTNRIEKYNILRNKDMDFNELRSDLLRESAQLCTQIPDNNNGEIKVENSTILFTTTGNNNDPDQQRFSCYTYFKVHVNELRLIHTWKYVGENYYQNIIIVIRGLRLDLKEFRMIGFNPKRTLIVFCSMYGSYSIYNSKLHGSILAPSSSFTTTNAIINGSIIVGNLRGSIATLNVPYVNC